MVRHALVIVLVLACGACGASDVRPTATSPATASAAIAPDLAAQFAYDARAPIELAVGRTSADGTLSVGDIDFASAKGGRARAYLITPPTTAAAPGMVVVAGSNQKRGDILGESLGIARRGVVVLVLEQSQVAAARQQIWTFTAQDRDEAVQTVVDARRAIDLLIARGVDPARIGFYGFSYGAWLGAITAAVDRRVGLAVLRSGGPQILAEIARASGRSLTPQYTAIMATVDQMAFAPGVGGVVLVQNGSRDTTYTADQIRAWQDRLGGAKTVKSYDAGHGLDAGATADSLAWIAERWRLP